MARPVIGIDFGHGETAVYMRIGSRIFPLRLDAAGSLKMITALALIESADEKQFVIVTLAGFPCSPAKPPTFLPVIITESAT